MRKITLLSLLLLLPFVVSAHTEEPEPTTVGFGINAYLITLVIISVVVAIGIVLLRHFESRPGSLPIKQLSIAAGLTVAVNAIIFAILYLEM